MITFAPRTAQHVATLDTGDPIGQYLKDISTKALLTAQEERTATRDVLIERNLRLVVSIARQFGGDISLADRIQVGNIGLMRAAEKFDPNHGAKFSTYATWWIKQAIMRHMAEYSGLIRLPTHVSEDTKKLGKAALHISADPDYEPTPEELATATGFTVAKVQRLQQALHPVCSLDVPLNEGSHQGTEVRTLASMLAAPEEISDGLYDSATRSRQARVIEALQQLPEREAAVLVMRYGIGRENGQGMTLAEAGRAWGLTRERIRQIEVKAMRHLRDALGLQCDCEVAV